MQKRMLSILFISATLFLCNYIPLQSIRNPFEFSTTQEKITEKSTSDKTPDLSKWNIRENDNVLILENKETGDIRIIEAVSFIH